MELTDHLQILIEHLMEILSLFPGLCKDHRQVQTDCTDIEPPHKNRHILFIGRLHAAPLIPWT